MLFFVKIAPMQIANCKLQFANCTFANCKLHMLQIATFAAQRYADTRRPPAAPFRTAHPRPRSVFRVARNLRALLAPRAGTGTRPPSTRPRPRPWSKCRRPRPPRRTTRRSASHGAARPHSPPMVPLEHRSAKLPRRRAHARLAAGLLAPLPMHGERHLGRGGRDDTDRACLAQLVRTRETLCAVRPPRWAIVGTVCQAQSRLPFLRKWPRLRRRPADNAGRRRKRRAAPARKYTLTSWTGTSTAR